MHSVVVTLATGAASLARCSQRPRRCLKSSLIALWLHHGLSTINHQ